MHFSSIFFKSAVLLTFGLFESQIEAKTEMSIAKSFKIDLTSDDLSSTPTIKRFYDQTGMNGGNPHFLKRFNQQYNKNMNNGKEKSKFYDYNDPIQKSPNQQYLKSMNVNTNTNIKDLDDLEFDYEDTFLKRGLVMAGDFEGLNTYDTRFMETLKKFYASLMQQTTPFLPELSADWKSSPGESVYRTPRLYTKFKSIDCENLAMRLRMIGTIYSGHRNRVIKLLDRGSKKLFAYKTYGNPDEFYAEREMFLWLEHPYFVKAICHRKDTETGNAGILFEFIDGMSSMEYARKATPQQLQMISGQLFLAIEHLHWLGVVHADLKPENVLVKKDGTVQVIDLGFAIHLPQSKRKRGTHTTMAPELHSLVPGKCHEAIDWWAYGSTVAIWYGFNENFKNDDGKRFIPLNWQNNQFVNGIVPWRFPQELRNFLQVFFQPDPETRRIHTKRLLKQIRDDPFFYGLDWTALFGGVLS